MAADQERLDQIREWWKEYRWTIIGGTAIGVLAVGGWSGWKEYTRIEQEAASVLFQEVAVAVVQADAVTARQAFDDLIDGYESSAYAEKARLLMARVSYDAGEADEARALLQEAIRSSSEKSTIHAARIRLAQLMIADGQYQEALDTLGSANAGGFESHYQELRGDAYRGLNRNDEAKDAYQASIDSLNRDSDSYRTILTLKLNDTLIEE